MKVTNVTGFFDCRVYKKDTKRAQRQMAKQGDRINISLAFDEAELPDEFKEFARTSEKNDRYYVAVKVFPANIKAFSASAQPIDFPTNEQLDGNSFAMNMECSIKHGTGTELNGVYANKIQFIKRTNNDFEAVEDGDDNLFGVNITPQHLEDVYAPKVIELAKLDPEKAEPAKATKKADNGLPF